MLSSDFCKKKSIRYCQANRPNVEVEGNKLVVVFKSNKRSKGGAGATCTATCASKGTTTPAPATTPTTPSPATTPTTPAPATTPTTPVPTTTPTTGPVEALVKILPCSILIQSLF